MTPEETALIKRAVQYIEIARSSDYVTFNAMLAGNKFNEEVIEPLKGAVGWNETDKEETEKLAKDFKEETKGRTLQEKSRKLFAILAISGGIAAALSVASGAIIASRK